MQLRVKRAKSPLTQDSIPQRRALEHRSRKEATLSSLHIQSNSDNRAGHFSFPQAGKFTLLVKGNLWTTRSQDSSTIPMYILDALAHNPESRADKRHKIHKTGLTEGVFRAGDNYIVDEIEKDGAEMQVTKYEQSEIAFRVTRRDIKCAGHKLAMIGRPYDHAQYIGWISRGLIEEQVLNSYAIDCYGERYQTKARVRY